VVTVMMEARATARVVVVEPREGTSIRFLGNLVVVEATAQKARPERVAHQFGSEFVGLPLAPSTPGPGAA
jgi:hypothetical protein